MNTRCRLVVVVLLLAVAGCTSTATTPATPANVEVLTYVKSGSWATVDCMTPAGAYPALPSSVASGGYRVSFDAPYSTALRVLFDNMFALPDFDTLAAGADTSASGYFRVQKKDASPTPARWTVAIVPPKNAIRKPHDLTITNVSTNGSTASAPLTIKLTDRPMITISRNGGGAGTIEMTGGAKCPPSCTPTLGYGLPTLDLRATAHAGSKFLGWAADCVSQHDVTCVVDAEASPCLSAAATFERESVASVCPSPTPQQNETFIGSPRCSNIADHPSAIIQCDANGYFCCESVGGANSPRCGGAGRREFAADCMVYGPKAILRPGGCFMRTTP